MSQVLLHNASTLARQARWIPGVEQFQVDLGAGRSVGFVRNNAHKVGLGDFSDSDEDTWPESFPRVCVNLPAPMQDDVWQDVKFVATLNINWVQASAASAVLDNQVKDLHEAFSKCVQAIPQGIVDQSPQHFTFKVTIRSNEYSEVGPSAAAMQLVKNAIVQAGYIQADQVDVSEQPTSVMVHIRNPTREQIGSVFSVVEHWMLFAMDESPDTDAGGSSRSVLRLPDVLPESVDIVFPA